MIVAFSEMSRQPDGTSSNGVARSYRSEDDYIAGQMIVSFADRRSRSTDGSRSSVGQESGRSVAEPSSRRTNGRISRKQTSPSGPVARDPPGVHLMNRMISNPVHGKAPKMPESSDKATKARSQREIKATRPVVQDVIVEFPRAPRRGDSKDHFSLSGAFRKNKPRRLDAPKKEPNHASRSSHHDYFDSSNDSQNVIVEFPKHNRSVATKLDSSSRSLKSTISERSTIKPETATPCRRHISDRSDKGIDSSMRSLYSHARQFDDAVDWRNTSIDWGDEKDDMSSAYGKESVELPFIPEKVSPRPDPISRKNCSVGGSHKTAELTDSNMSLLSASLSSLLSIRKIDP